MKVYIVSLGCPKNLTDTEVLMGQIVAAGGQIVGNPAEADEIIINSCAFIKSARLETEETIREMKKYGKKVFLAGCYPKWNRKVKSVDGIIDTLGLYDCNAPRLKATPPWYAYVKISEGCDNRCAYCLIPSIRGRLRNRPAADVLREVRGLAKRGVKEIIFVAQDTTAHPDFPKILSRAAKIKGLRWLRVMYAHPAHVTDKLLNVMAREKKIVKYLDLPIQHCNDKILELMKRRYTRQVLESLIEKIRRKIPKIALRTSVIVGFPGEGEAEFQELLGFLDLVKFEKLGAFTYWREPGTPADNMRGQVPDQVKRSRLSQLMRRQARISKELNHKLIGKIIEVMVEEGALGRSAADAPKIDGRVMVKSKIKQTPGQIVRARITGAKTYDLVGAKV